MISEKLQKAAKEEADLRSTAFVFKTDRIGNYKVWSLTPRLVLILSLTDNPLMTGKPMDIFGVGEFLHIIMVDKKPSAHELTVEITMLPREELEKLVQDIDDYLELSFHDLTGSEDEVRPVNRDYCSVASIIDLLANEYGWEDEYILDLPYRRIAQYIRAIARRKEPGVLFANPIYDKAMAEFLKELNPHLYKKV